MYHYAVEAHIRFLAVDPLHAIVSVQNETFPGVVVTIIHEMVDDASTYDVPNHAASPHIEVSDGESLTLIGRCSGRIIGSATFEVDGSAADMGYILRPTASANMLCEQTAVADVCFLHHVDEVEVQAC